MHRSPLLALLRAYAPLDAADAACRERFTAFVAAHTNCFERALTIGHVTGSAWIVDRAGRRVLLTHHRKLDIWVQPGGHADGDPDIAAVAAREAREETGLAGLELCWPPTRPHAPAARQEPGPPGSRIGRPPGRRSAGRPSRSAAALAPRIFDLDIHPIPERGDVPGHDHFDVRFAFRATGGEAFVVSDESHALAWVALDELEEYTREPSMLRMRKKWLAALASGEPG